MNNVDLLIIGGGPAGMAAAVSAHENGLKDIIILERDVRLGGILGQCIHTGFGLHYFGEELTGPEYAARFIDMVNDSSVQVKLNTMVLNISNEGGLNVQAVNSSDGLMSLVPKAVVLAMGCRERTRGALNIPGTRPAGVITAGAAQRLVNLEGFMPGKGIVILGSGDIGLIMARRLTLEGAYVAAVLEAMPYSGGLKRNIVQCLEDFNIPLMLNRTVVQVHGSGRVTGVTHAAVDRNIKPIPGTYEYIPCDTLMLSVGLIPENELSLKLGAPIDRATGGPLVNNRMQTEIPGVFACGNVVQVHDLVDFVTDEGMRAGRGAADYIKGLLKTSAVRVRTKAGNGVRYVVPHVIEGYTKEPVKLYFRCRDIMKKAAIRVMYGGECIKTVKRPYMAPGEMESVTLEPEALNKINGSASQLDKAELLLEVETDGR